METIDPGIQLLNEQNRALYRSPEVSQVVGFLTMHGVEVGPLRTDRIAAYMGFLADPQYANDGILTGNTRSLNRQVARSVLQESAGLTPEKLDRIQTNQEYTLRPWAEHLGKNEAHYPNWFRLYAFEGVKGLRPYSRAKDGFARRQPNTRMPYPQLHQGALALTYDLLLRAKINGETVEGGYDNPKQEAAFQTALRSASFRALYVHSLRETKGVVTDKMRAITDGEWKIYNKGRHIDQFFRDLQGFSLEWCIAKNYPDAKEYMNLGDMYIYRTKDETGVPRVPRLAVCANGTKIIEIGGIDPRQEVESVLLEELRSFLVNLPGRAETELIRLQDAKEWYALKAKLNANPKATLSKHELIFFCLLYTSPSPRDS